MTSFTNKETKERDETMASSRFFCVLLKRKECVLPTYFVFICAIKKAFEEC